MFSGFFVCFDRYSDNFVICCVAHDIATTCKPPPPEFSSCDDLLAGVHLKATIWIIAVLSIGFNLVAFVSRVRNKSPNKVNSFLISQLAIADMTMGLYLAMVGAADIFLKNRYYQYDHWWRHSDQCKVAGILAVTGSEASVFILVLITAERIATLVFWYNPTARMTINQSRVAVLGVWILSITLAIIPAFGMHYFGEFYSTSTVCLALPLSSDKPRGWEYAIGVFSVLNLGCFLGISVGYGVILKSLYNSSSQVSSSLGKMNRAVTGRFLAIILTDFFCWGPLSIMGFLTLANVNIPSSMFVYVAVFVLPINSALNPFIYTFTSSDSIQSSKQCLKRLMATFCCTCKTQPQAHSMEMVAVNRPQDNTQP